MALSRETTVARADMNDEFGVTVWQAKKTADYTIAEARELAAEIVRAANEAERIARDDAWQSEGDLPEGFGFDVDLTGASVGLGTQRIRLLTAEETEQMMTAIRDPEYRKVVAEEYRLSRAVEVDNPIRREVRPRRGAEGSQ